MRTTAILIGSALLWSLASAGCDEPEVCLGACGAEPGSYATLTPREAYPDCRSSWSGEFYENGDSCRATTHHSRVPMACDACECGAECTSAAECPLPETGNATPACEQAHCVLSCDDDHSCPDEQECVDGRCNYISYDAFHCTVELEGPDPCGGIGDETSCNATVSEEGAHQCAWVERRTVVSSESCTVATSGFECIHTRDTPAGCSDAASCGAEGPRMYWSDEGAGVTDLLLVPCGLEPVANFYNDLWVEECDFSGSAPLPLGCGCGCDED